MGHEVPMEMTWDRFRFYSESDFLFAGESDFCTYFMYKMSQVSLVLDNMT